MPSRLSALKVSPDRISCGVPARKCYTNVKTDLVNAGVNKIVLSQMDMAFMFTYAIGSFISGRLGDMFPQNIIIGVGLLGSTLCLVRALD